MTGEYKLVNEGNVPSQNISLRDTEWRMDQYAGSMYTWGRLDAGEPGDVNRNYAFSEAWADAKWQFRKEQRHYLPTIGDAFLKFTAGEAI